MIPPDQNPVGTIALIAVGLLQGVSMFRAERREQRQLDAHEATQKAVEKVEHLVNGPLGESLKSTAAALLHVAHLTGSDADILAAVAAQKRSDEHASQSVILSEFKAARAAAHAKE